MIEITATKYWSHAKYSDPIVAQREIEKLREKHPTREYTILVNARATYYKFAVAQVRHVSVDVPEPVKDFPFPPEPSAVAYPDWASYRADLDAYNRDLKRHQGDYKAVLTEKLNK